MAASIIPPRTKLDITGERYGRWTVLEFVCDNPKHSYWLCCCDCGTEAVVVMNSLRKGASQSCGCLRLERIAAANITHGFTVGRKMPLEYGVWSSMKARCYNPRTASFQNYGGRGITVCDEWFDSFEQFLADMGSCPPGLTLERRDNNGPYAPWNCEWATYEAQANNKRGLRIISLEDERINVTAAARRHGIEPSVVLHRIYRGWPEERWFETPRGHRRAC